MISWGETETERDFDLANNLFLLRSNTSGNSSAPFGEGTFPMKPFRVIFIPRPSGRIGRTGNAVRGVPGDVGGLAIGAELIEWAPRLCEREVEGKDSGLRVFVNVIVTAKGSPAK